MSMERRANARVRRLIGASVRFYDVQGSALVCHKEWHCELRDLSEGGVGVEVDRPITVGTKLTMRIAVENPATFMSMKAQVCWCQETTTPGLWRVGLWFKDEKPIRLAVWAAVVDRVRTLLQKSDNAAA